MLESLYQPILSTTSYTEVLIGLVFAFTGLYFFMSTSFYLFGKIARAKKWASPVSLKPLFKGQIAHEITYSFGSIIIFAAYGAFTIFLYRQQVINISFDGGWHILLDLLILAVWNEIHFISGHRLMHTKVLVRFHRVHHKSVVVTPFSTYSFHPVESLVMGSVMILPLLVYPFEIVALIVFPIYHLFFNTVGHSNLQFSNRKNPISQQHNAHHTSFNYNFGFLFHQMGKVFRNH